MRQRTYYSKDQITNGLYTFGQEWQLLNGTEYKGLYHRYSTGEVYTESEWNEKISKKLVAFQNISEVKKLYKTINPKLKSDYVMPQKYFVSLSPKDISNRVITRYFLKRVNTTDIIEIDKEQQKRYNKKEIDNNLYQLLELQWHVAGTIETTFTGTAKQSGVRELNELSVKQAKQQMPEISNYLTNPLEFYIDTDLIVPPDIN